MNVLVTAASKHQGTAGIADAIAGTLRHAGLAVTVLPVEEVVSLDGFDAVVAGSAVYGGHWLKAARQFVEQHAVALAARPVWLFSSGPIGDPPKPLEDPVDATALMRQTHARDHRVFGGVLDPAELGLGERGIVRALRAPMGDFRDFAQVAAWAEEIAAWLGQHGRQRISR